VSGKLGFVVPYLHANASHFLSHPSICAMQQQLQRIFSHTSINIEANWTIYVISIVVPTDGVIFSIIDPKYMCKVQQQRRRRRLLADWYTQAPLPAQLSPSQRDFEGLLFECELELTSFGGGVTDAIVTSHLNASFLEYQTAVRDSQPDVLCTVDACVEIHRLSGLVSNISMSSVLPSLPLPSSSLWVAQSPTIPPADSQPVLPLGAIAAICVVSVLLVLVAAVFVVFRPRACAKGSPAAARKLTTRAPLERSEVGSIRMNPLRVAVVSPAGGGGSARRLSKSPSSSVLV
jgi:hypothetical protein